MAIFLVGTMWLVVAVAVPALVGWTVPISVQPILIVPPGLSRMPPKGVGSKPATKPLEAVGIGHGVCRAKVQRTLLIHNRTYHASSVNNEHTCLLLMPC